MYTDPKLACVQQSTQVLRTSTALGTPAPIAAGLKFISRETARMPKLSSLSHLCSYG